MANANLFQAYLQPARSVSDYANDYAKADALKNQNALQALTLQQAGDVQGQRNAFRNLVGAGADLNDAATQARALAVAPDVAPGLLKTVQDSKTSAAKAALDTAQAGGATANAAKTTQETAIAAHQQHLQQLSTVNTPQDAVQWLLDGVKTGALPETRLAPGLQALQQNSQTPEGFAQWKSQTQQGGLSVLQQMQATEAKPTEVRLGNVVKMIDTNPRSQTFGKEIIGAQSIGQSPDNAATQAGENARARLSSNTQLTAAGIRADGTPIDGAGLSEQARIAAATRYRIDGTLPAGIGRGTQGARDTRAILDEAASQSAAAGDTPEAARIAQIANKANSAALNKLQQQQTMVGAFEKNFTKNADMAEQLSAAVDRTGVPIVNKWINAGKRSVSGDADLSAFDASLKATVNEYAKIVSGATGGAGAAQGEIAKVEGLLNAAQTTGQVSAVLNLMRKETQNRMAAFDDEKSQLTGSMVHPGSRPAAPAGGVPADIQAIIDRHGKK